MAGERRLLITWAMSAEAERAIYFCEFEDGDETDANYAEVVRQMCAATKQHLLAGEHIDVEDAPWSPTEYLNATKWSLPHSLDASLPRRIDQFVGEYRFLSNFFPSEVTTDNGSTYATVEHAYQVAKATTEEERAAIAAAPNPKKAKKLGSKVAVSPDWHSRKIEVMRTMLRLKFAPGSELAAKLVATGDAELVEGNDWGDEFWGECNGVGENHLGRLLMEIRDRLRGSRPLPEDRRA